MTDLREPLKFGAVVAALAIVATVVFMAVGVAVQGIGEQRSTSDYSGHVVDVENQRGIVLQTTQIHLKTDKESSNAETFCVHPDNRDEQLPKLRQAVNSGDRVTVTYSRPLYVPVWTCEAGTSIIRNVEVNDA